MNGFNVGEYSFEKIDGGIKIFREVPLEGIKEFFINNDTWISIITEMSHRPENSDQHEEAKVFHLGKGGS